MADAKKSIRFHILVDEKFRKMVELAAHDSWMSVGQYIRDTVTLFDGATYDNASDIVMIGKEVGLTGLENLREAAERRGMTIPQFCESLVKAKANSNATEVESEEEQDPNQLSLF